MSTVAAAAVDRARLGRAARLGLDRDRISVAALDTGVVKLKLPSAETGRSSLSLFCSTRPPPDKPLTVPGPMV